MADIKGFHAHVYFNAETLDAATGLCRTAEQMFDVKMGRVHEKPVGPHPLWSCQLAFDPETFGKIVPWLATHRNGLAVLVHPETGDDVKDHTEHAIWMGEVLRLDISVLA